jgi:hypothetical protein
MFDLGLVDALVRPTKYTTSHNRNSDGEYDETKYTGEKNLLAKRDSDPPQDSNREANNCGLSVVFNKTSRYIGEMLRGSEDVA